MPTRTCKVEHKAVHQQRRIDVDKRHGEDGNRIDDFQARVEGYVPTR